MGLTAHTKNALKISLGHQASHEVIGLLDRLSDELQAERQKEADSAKAAGPNRPPLRAA